MRREFAHIDEILEKYWNGESSLLEENELRSYFRSGSVDEAHEPFMDIFSYFDQQASIMPTMEEKVRIPAVRRIFPGVVRIAASVALLVMAGWFIYQQVGPAKAKTEDPWAKYEVTDPAQAREVARDALVFLSARLNRGEANVKEQIRELEKLPFK